MALRPTFHCTKIFYPILWKFKVVPQFIILSISLVCKMSALSKTKKLKLKPKVKVKAKPPRLVLKRKLQAQRLQKKLQEKELKKLKI